MAQAMAQPVMDPEGAPAAAGGGRRGRSPIVVALLTALIVGPICIGAFFVYSQRTQQTKKDLAEWEADPPLESLSYAMAVQTVNLADGDRYVRCRPVLVFRLDPVDAAYFREWLASQPGHEDDPQPPAQDDKPLPKKEPSDQVRELVYNVWKSQAQLDDATIRELGSRRYDELLAEEDKDRLAQALLERYNQILKSADLPVHDVLMSEFIMQ